MEGKGKEKGEGQRYLARLGAARDYSARFAVALRYSARLAVALHCSPLRGRGSLLRCEVSSSSSSCCFFLSFLPADSIGNASMPEKGIFEKKLIKEA